jgi:hypothetical protein
VGDNVNVGTAQPYFFIRKKLWRRALGGVRRAAAASCEGWMTQVVPRTDVTAAHSTEPALRVPAARSLAVRTRCCACPCSAFPCCAPSCWACGALVQRSPRLCDIRLSTSSTSRSARLHRAALVDVADTTPLVDPGDLTCLPATGQMPFPILSPIGLLLLAHMPRATVLACLVAMLSAITIHFAYFTAYFVLFPACGCASERWHRSRCPQLNTPATLFTTLFLRSLLPLCLLCFQLPCFLFCRKKRKTRRNPFLPLSSNS